MSDADHPYRGLPASRYWRSAVADRHPSEIGPLWEPKQPLLPHDRIASFGSCFAQHIGRALNAHGHRWLITEPAPHGLSEAHRQRYNYDVFSCRTGNVYTPSLLLQWLRWAFGVATPPDEAWRTDAGRWIDPFRPAIEPDGFADVDELLRSRAVTLRALRAAVVEADVLVFTLGLTESWFHVEGHEYPMCPGTIAGRHDASRHRFVNQDHARVLAAMQASMALAQASNQRLRWLLTVSPVPLAATRADQHVLVANMHSKAVLRAVAGQLAATRRDVDYFPSFEIVTAPPFRGAAYAPNQREIARAGVDSVMRALFDALDHRFPGRQRPTPETRIEERPHGMPQAGAEEPDGRERAARSRTLDEPCEEALLAAFGPR